MTNIPIYRALKVGTEDEWVEGYYAPKREWKTRCLKCGGLNTDSYHKDYSEWAECFDCDFNKCFHDDIFEHGYIGDIKHLICDLEDESFEIDPSTLSINFPDMKDADDKPIFASLSEDGRGGDILVNAKAYESFALTEILNFTAKYKNRCMEFSHKDLKVIGIQK